MASHRAAVVRAFESASFIAPWAFLDSIEYASVASGCGDAAMIDWPGQGFALQIYEELCKLEVITTWLSGRK